MKNKENILLGIILIIIGLVIGAKTLNIIDVNIFFKGWWTLFIIIPSLLGLINDKSKTGNIILLVIGIILLLSTRGLLDIDLVFKLMFPIIIIILGLSLIFKNTFNKGINTNNDNNYFAAFSTQDIKLNEETFKGTDLNAIFGSIKLDLTKAIIKEDVVINTSSIFGGIDIIIPDSVDIKVKSNSLFGSVDNNKKPNEETKKHTIYINATCMFGGVKIK